MEVDGWNVRQTYSPKLGNATDHNMADSNPGDPGSAE